MHLSARLLKLASKVPDDTVVADIGTDHALLPIYLVSIGRCPRAIAVEAAEGPFRRAREAIAAFGLEDSIDLRFGNGIEVLQPGEVDVAVIAGIGGTQIVSILEAQPAVRASIRRFVLQPTRGAAEVRRFLHQNGYRLCDEELVPEARQIHEIIVAEPGVEAIDDEILYEIGPRLLERRDPLLGAFIRERIQHYRRILLQVEAGQTQRALEALREFQERIRRLGQVAEQLGGPPMSGGSP
ncbi:MAG TPA: class I SAM-dependent methyltransferase [Bacillota bacterium]